MVQYNNNISNTSIAQTSSGELWRISKFIQVGFQFKGNVAIFPTNFTITGSEFHRVGAATEKALGLTFVLTLGTKSRLELDDRSCLGCPAIVKSECRYDVCLDKSA